ncbi:MAG: hypothetical protein K2H63_08290 [Paramuribaculum sp.]|nr:hypothetical protein [Paramuribaculum sp.]
MEVLLIVALLASNLYLIGKVLKKNETNVPEPSPPKNDFQLPISDDDKSNSLIGRSHVDKALLQIIHEEVKDEVARVRKEFTSPEDVGLEQEEEPKSANPTIPQDQLDEVFTHKTIGESFYETPEEREPCEGDDFKALESAVRVAKDEPHTPEEAEAARNTLRNLQGTIIEDRLTLDPKVRKRILSIIYQDDDTPLTEDSLSKKKVIYSKTLDTTDIDKIDFNILT